MNGNTGSIVIESVSNLTISGRESGSLIQCSSNSTFGLHFSNATNVTLTGITIRNCGFFLNQAFRFNCYECNTSILIEASRDVNISGVHIEYSRGYAVVVTDNSINNQSEVPFFFTDNVNPHLTLTDCTLSHTRGLAHMWIDGYTSVLIEKTVMTNSDGGIVSSCADIMMKNVDVINCTISSLWDGRAVVRGGLTMNNSYLEIVNQELHIHSRKSEFYDEKSSLLIIHNTVTGGTASAEFLWSTVSLSGAELLLKENECYKSPYILIIYNTSIVMKNGSLFSVTQNKVHHLCALIDISDSTVTLSGTELLLKENEGYDYSTLLRINNTSTIMNNGSIVSVTQNRIRTWLVAIVDGVWNSSSDSELSVTENILGRGGYSFSFYSTNASLQGPVVLANNTVNYDGAMNIRDSRVWFHGRLEVIGNRGVFGAITVLNSDIFITHRATFVDNVADYGGALNLFSSVMFLSTSAKVDFTRNQATELGGAIYISNPRNTMFKCDADRVAVCSIQVMPDSSSEDCQLFSMTFNQNKAGVAGNAIYGDRTLACLPKDDFCSHCPFPYTSDIYQYNGVNDSSDLSNFTSDPTRVCFCENGIPDCYRVLSNIAVHPGERFYLSLAVVGYGLGTVPGSVIARGRGNVSFGNALESVQEIRQSRYQDVGYSIVSENDREQIALAVDTLSFTRSLGNVLVGHYSNFMTYFFSNYEKEFLNAPVFVEVELLPCPVGFQLDLAGKCICHQILDENNIETCYFFNSTAYILRPAPYWIGLPNDTNSSILIHPHCPYDYCSSKDINITAESPNTLCQYQRSGVLCGSCREGLSMILGSSECNKCSNLFLLSISIFIVMGVALVAVVTLLNMTVSVGTLNGLILFANILQANKTTFLPRTTSNTSGLIIFLSAFIAWLNLDLGIPMCFFNGLTTYVKTWLQFVFPLYILALVGVIIIASKYSTRMTRILGTNAVSVLATLVLLSYTKILRILITAFSFTKLTGSQGYHSVVWLADGNIQYLETKHAVLFLVALLVLLLLGLPYTVTLTAAPWIQRSRFQRVSSLYNKFKPLFDAYMGPYKDRYRYWMGMLLLARVVLIVLFSSIANTNTVAGPQLNLLLLILSSSTLIGLSTTLKPYKTRLLNGLELFYLVLLLILSSNLYISSIGTGIGPRTYIYVVLVGMSFLVFLGICGGHIWYRLRKVRTGRRPEPPPEREEEEYRPLVWRMMGRVRTEDEEGEDAMLLTAGTNENTVTDRGRVSEYRDSALELVTLNY